MTTDYKEVLERETRNKIATDLTMQSTVLLYQAALIRDDSAEEQKLRAQLHALTDVSLDCLAVQVHCIKHMPPVSS